MGRQFGRLAATMPVGLVAALLSARVRVCVCVACVCVCALDVLVARCLGVRSEEGVERRERCGC
eukprot:8472-Eustigmatos_ZCMA.PRE.1